MLLARAVADDLAWVRESLYDAGTAVPETFAGLAPGPIGVALVALGVLALGLAVGTFLVSGETAAAFALLAAATVGWFLFPYAEVPWATVLTGDQTSTPTPPASTWWIGGAIVALATVEILASAREQLLDQLRTNRLPAGPGTRVHGASRAATLKVALVTLLGGGLLLAAYAAARDAIGSSLIPDPDLLYVPLALGALGGLVLWWLGRED